MTQIRVYGAFRGGATEPLAFFTMHHEADQYARNRQRVRIKPCLVEWELAVLPCDRCELDESCIVQPFTDDCEPEWETD